MPEQIPVKVEGNHAVNVPISVDGDEYRMTCISMGNPHAVVYLDDIQNMEIEKLDQSLSITHVFRIE